MRICINSKNLSELQRTRIENYFQENFSFEGKKPVLIWKEDESDSILLGYPHGDSGRDQMPPDFTSIMFRVHENELQSIAGRDFCSSFGNFEP